MREIKRNEVVEIDVNGRKDIVKFMGLSRRFKGYFNYMTTEDDGIVHCTKIENIVRVF